MKLNSIDNQNFNGIRLHALTKAGKKVLHSTVVPKMDLFAVNELERSGYDVLVNLTEYRRIGSTEFEGLTFAVVDKLKNRSKVIFRQVKNDVLGIANPFNNLPEFMNKANGFLKKIAGIK